MITKQTTTIYVDSKEGFEYKFPPIEDTVTVSEIDSGYLVKYLTPDDMPVNPREEYTNNGKIIHWHKRWSSFGEIDISKNGRFTNKKDLEDWIKKEYNAFVLVPIFMYDHSGVAIRTYPFTCPFDSGQVGYIFATKEEVKNTFKSTGKKAQEKYIKLLVDEIETYNQYLANDVYCLVQETYDNDKNPINYDTVGGFFGLDYAIQGLKEGI